MRKIFLRRKNSDTATLRNKKGEKEAPSDDEDDTGSLLDLNEAINTIPFEGDQNSLEKTPRADSPTRLTHSGSEGQAILRHTADRPATLDPTTPRHVMPPAVFPVQKIIDNDRTPKRTTSDGTVATTNRDPTNKEKKRSLKFGASAIKTLREVGKTLSPEERTRRATEADDHSMQSPKNKSSSDNIHSLSPDSENRLVRSGSAEDIVSIKKQSRRSASVSAHDDTAGAREEAKKNTQLSMQQTMDHIVSTIIRPVKYGIIHVRSKRKGSWKKR